MSEARFETVLQELRDAAPQAPERLRELVRTLPAARPRLALRLRPALSAAIALVLAVGLGAAILGGLDDVAQNQRGERADYFGAPGAATTDRQSERAPKEPLFAPAFAPTLTAKSRLQRQHVAMELRVKDLSAATQRAVRSTRRLGGYVAAAWYSTETKAGDSRLELRVPVQNVQKAIARFTDLGTILAQQISVADLQAGLDRLEARIARARREGDETTLKRLERSRQALVREGTYARVSLRLTTRTPAERQVEPGRFERFWGNATDILGKELIAVLYVLVIAGPFLLLAAIALFAERARRRRADHRLLEETG